MIPTLYEIGYLVNYNQGDTSLQRTFLPLFGGVEDKYHTVKDGDTLENIAQDYYGDQLLWYLIADANPDVITDIFQLTINTTLLIPDLDIVDLLYG